MKRTTSTRFLLWLFSVSACLAQDYMYGTCDKVRNAGLPFCDSSLTNDVRVQDLVGRLTLNEKIGLLIHNTRGATTNVELNLYNWWNEALHGVATHSLGCTKYRYPTEFSTVFPQPISLAAAFSKQLFSSFGDATGNEARAFYNAGNGCLTYWSPNINIYRDPRWGRGHETPGEDPYLNKIYALLYVKAMQGDHENGGFLKTSACCKHFSAHSLENDRHSFDAIVNEQDMADTYLPAFKGCVEEARASCVMCAYNSVNGIPACADKGLLTGTIRQKWNFDGYIVSDCWAVNDIYNFHNYTPTPSGTCHAVLDEAIDIECGNFFTMHLLDAINDGSVSEQMLNIALTRAFRVLMRLGYFEKEVTRPYKDLLPQLVNSLPHQALALDASRQSIVLLKNLANASSGRSQLPLDVNQFNVNGATLALIGPHLNASDVLLGNYHGIPSSITRPLDEILKFIPNLQYEFGCDLVSFGNDRLQQAEDLARASTQVVLFVGLDATHVEYEEQDRLNLTFTGLQNELIRRVVNVAQEPIILVVVSGGAMALEEWENHPKVGAILWAGYLGQSGGQAIADVLFAIYNPSGRLTQTFYANTFVSQVDMHNMNMRPVGGSPGRTYRFFTGQPVYPFGYGLSYTTFAYTFENESGSEHKICAEPTDDECQLTFDLLVRNSGTRSGDHSVLWFLAPPNAGQLGRPIKSLLDFEKIRNLQPRFTSQIRICLNHEHFQLANEQGEFEVVTGEWKLLVGNLERTILVSNDECRSASSDNGATFPKTEAMTAVALIYTATSLLLH